MQLILWLCERLRAHHLGECSTVVVVAALDEMVSYICDRLSRRDEMSLNRDRCDVGIKVLGYTLVQSSRQRLIIAVQINFNQSL